MQRTKRFRILINSIHIVIGLYLLTISNGFDMIPILPDTPEDYKNSEKHGYVLIVLGVLAFSQIFNIINNINLRKGGIKEYINTLGYWDLIHIVHLVSSGPLLILLGLSKIGKFDYIDKEAFRSISLYLGVLLIVYHSIKMIYNSRKLY